MRDFIDDEAEVSTDARESSDECDIDDTAALEDLKGFVNDASQLTQHDEQDGELL